MKGDHLGVTPGFGIFCMFSEGLLREGVLDGAPCGGGERLAGSNLRSEGKGMSMVDEAAAVRTLVSCTT